MKHEHNPPPRKRLRILSTDDDPGIRALLWEVLGGDGHEMKFAKDGKEVFQRLKESAFDLLILDVNMPEMDGYHVSRAIHDKLRNPPKTLIFTGRDIDQERYQFFASDADAILPKSAPVDEILRTIASLFQEEKAETPPETPAFIPEPPPPGESLEIIHGAPAPEAAPPAAPVPPAPPPPAPARVPPPQSGDPKLSGRLRELSDSVKALGRFEAITARQETTLTELALMKKTLAGISARLELNNRRLDQTRAAAVAALAAVLVFGLTFAVLLTR